DCDIQRRDKAVNLCKVHQFPPVVSIDVPESIKSAYPKKRRGSSLVGGNITRIRGLQDQATDNWYYLCSSPHCRVSEEDLKLRHYLGKSCRAAHLSDFVRFCLVCTA